MNAFLLYSSIVLFVVFIVVFIRFKRIYAIGFMFLLLHIIQVKLPQEYTKSIPDVFPLLYILIAICLFVFSKIRGEFKISED